MRSLWALVMAVVSVACACSAVGCSNALVIDIELPEPGFYEMIVCVEHDPCVTQTSNVTKVEWLQDPPTGTVELEFWIRHLDAEEPFFTYSGLATFEPVTVDKGGPGCDITCHIARVAVQH